jgi:hypothetical protein
MPFVLEDLSSEEFLEKFFPKQTEEEKRKVLTPEIAKKIIKIIEPYTRQGKEK